MGPRDALTVVGHHNKQTTGIVLCEARFLTGYENY